MIIFIADIIEKNAILTPEESWHCCKVLRKRPGDRIRVIDGKGKAWEAELDLVTEKKCSAFLLAEVQGIPVRRYFLHLAIAPTKQIDRIEWMLEKAVEIGVDEISFFHSEHSERDFIRTDRLRKICESAVKQSLQAQIPKVNEIVPLRKIMDEFKDHQRLIAHCLDNKKLSLQKIDFSSAPTTILIGPEGDFSPAEIEQAGQKGWRAVDLGPNRLRTETAGLFICAAASLLSQISEQ